jgi:SSS family transporter
MTGAPPIGMSLLAQFTLPDYVVLVVYFVACVLLGTWLGRGQDTLGEYFLAGRKTHWIVACISIIATDWSAISYIGIPGYLYTHDLKLYAGTIITPLAFLFVVRTFLPIFYRLKVFTVYEYLETRFHPLARTITAVLFLFQRGVWLAAAIYIPSLALATFSGIHVTYCIIALGLISAVYTMVGGMKAVIWTDFLQFLIMMGGLLLLIGILLQAFNWDVPGIWAQAGRMIAPDTGTPYNTLVDWRFDLKTEATVWSLLFFYLIYTIGTYGTDQVVVQRYFTMGTFREIATSVLVSGLLNVIVTFFLMSMGLLLAVYYHTHADMAAAITKPDQVLPHFVATVLPAGARGLILAALFAATMSSISSGFNSFATVGVMDLYRRHFKGAQADEAHNLRVARICTIVCGVLATLAALFISTYQTAIVQTLLSLAPKFIGPITGIFLLGALTRRGNLAGVCIGAALGLATSFLVELPIVKENVNWLWTGPLSSLVTFVTGYIASLAAPSAWTGLSETQDRPPADVRVAVPGAAAANSRTT